MKSCIILLIVILGISKYTLAQKSNFNYKYKTYLDSIASSESVTYLTKEQIVTASKIFTNPSDVTINKIDLMFAPNKYGQFSGESFVTFSSVGDSIPRLFINVFKRKCDIPGIKVFLIAEGTNKKGEKVNPPPIQIEIVE